MPDVTVTPSVTTVTIGAPATQLDVRTEIPRVIELYTECIHAGDFAAFTGNGGTITYTQLIDASTLGYARLTVPVGNPDACRAWISERQTGLNTKLMCGFFEMESRNRVRFNRNSSTTVQAMSGFFMGHAAPADPPGFANACTFWCYGSRTTWQVLLSSELDMSGPGGGFSKIVETSVAVADWHELRVWVAADASEAKFWIDGTLVHHETDSRYIPSGQEFGKAFSVNSGYGMHSGVMIRHLQTVTIESSFDADYVYSRFVPTRSST